MRKSNFALRLQPSLPAELRKAPAAEDAAINQFVDTTVAEKLSALRTEQYYRERAARSDVRRTMEILDRAGVGTPPLPGDEV